MSYGTYKYFTLSNARRFYLQWENSWYITKGLKVEMFLFVTIVTSRLNMLSLTLDFSAGILLNILLNEGFYFSCFIIYIITGYTKKKGHKAFDKVFFITATIRW